MRRRRLLRAQESIREPGAGAGHNTGRELLHGTQHGDAACRNQGDGLEGSHAPSAVLIW